MHLKSAFLAASLLAAAFVPAVASAADVLVVDFQRVYRDSLAGKDAQTKLRGVSDQINAELKPELEAWTKERDKLGPRFKDKTQEQLIAELQQDESLRKQYESVQTTLRALQEKQQLREQELQATEQRALAAVIKGTEPILTELLSERNAAVVLERGAITVAVPNADVTGEVVKRLDARLKAVPVTKVDLVKEAKEAEQRQAAQQRASVKP